MRFIRSKVFRAIPELDRFSDDECRRFIQAASSSWARRAIRWTLVASVALLGSALAGIAVIRACEAMQNSVRFGDILYMTIAASIAILGMAPSLLAAITLRDVLLRATVRRLIRQCGSCPRCRYSLLGTRVGTDLTILCPECGLRLDVDPALGELRTDAIGASIYSPTIAREHQETARRRSTRHRRFLKAATISTLAVALAVATLAAVAWSSIQRDAKRAADLRSAPARLSVIQRSLWTEGADPAGNEEWSRLITLAKEAQEQSFAIELSKRYALPANPRVMFCTSVLLPETTRAAFDRENGEGTYDASRALTIATLWDARQCGLLHRLQDIPSLCTPIRPWSISPDSQFSPGEYSGFAECNTLNYVNQTRLAAAILFGDHNEYMQAMTQSLAIARVMERQGAIHDRYAADRMRSMVCKRILADRTRYPDKQWAEDALAALNTIDRVPLARTLEFHRERGLDLVRWFFSDPYRVANCRLGIGNHWQHIVATTPGRVGSLDSNTEAWNALLTAWISQADVSQSKRLPLPTTTGFGLLDTISWDVGGVVAFADTCVAEQHDCICLLAADVFRIRFGRAPTSCDELRPLVTNPAWLVNPRDDLPYQLAVRTDPSCREHTTLSDSDPNPVADRRAPKPLGAP